MSPGETGAKANEFAWRLFLQGECFALFLPWFFLCLLNFSKYKKSANFILTPLYNCGKMEYTVLW